MNAAALFGDEESERGHPVRTGKAGWKAAMSGMTGFFIAVGTVSLICFALITRADRLRDRRRAYVNSTGGDGGGVPTGNDGFSMLNWFSGSSSSSSSSSDGSCTSSSSSSSFRDGDSGCGDGGSGGDGGGGGD